VAELSSLIGCTLEAFPQTYLGLPLMTTKLRVQHLVVKVEMRAPGWKSSLLNLGSRLVLFHNERHPAPTNNG
jgi:hypothetical protein